MELNILGKISIGMSEFQAEKEQKKSIFHFIISTNNCNFNLYKKAKFFL